MRVTLLIALYTRWNGDPFSGTPSLISYHDWKVSNRKTNYQQQQFQNTCTWAFTDDFFLIILLFFPSKIITWHYECVILWDRNNVDRANIGSPARTKDYLQSCSNSIIKDCTAKLLPVCIPSLSFSARRNVSAFQVPRPENDSRTRSGSQAIYP